jgi:hypothetical protein
MNCVMALSTTLRSTVSGMGLQYACVPVTDRPVVHVSPSEQSRVSAHVYRQLPLMLEPPPPCPSIHTVPGRMTGQFLALLSALVQSGAESHDCADALLAVKHITLRAATSTANRAIQR